MLTDAEERARDAWQGTEAVSRGLLQPAFWEVYLASAKSFR
jgi:hypothetical protein